MFDITINDENRNRISLILRSTSTALVTLAVMTKRTFISAFLVVAYLFYSATSDTTLYQLSQYTHTESFWMISFGLAFMYSMVYFSMTGLYIGKKSPVSASYNHKDAASK